MKHKSSPTQVVEKLRNGEQRLNHDASIGAAAVGKKGMYWDKVTSAVKKSSP